MNKKKIGQQIYSLVLIFLLFLQSSAQVVGAVTSSSSAADDSTEVQLLGATQEAAGSRNIDLKLSLNNSTDESIHKEVSVSVSNNQQLKETSNSNLDYSPRYWGHEIASGRSESNVWSVANTD